MIGHDPGLRRNMFCITGNETRLDDLAGRLEAPGLHEIRSDYLDERSDPLFPLVARHKGRIIFTCRSQAEGGAFAGSPGDQAALIERAIRAGVAWVDVELAMPAELRQRISHGRDETRLLLSSHILRHDPTAWPQVARALSAEPADALKLAVTVADALELGVLSSLFAGEARPVVRLGMGEAGLISRVLYRAFGSPWTYAAWRASMATAPGQLTVEGLRNMRAGEPGLTPLALVGGPQVMASPGPLVYNRLFEAHSLPYCYVPVISARAAEMVMVLRQWGFGGASVTMPGKVDVLSRMDELGAEARQYGAVNTVLIRPDRLIGHNTDGPGTLDALAIPVAGKRAMVLGAGGLGRAVAGALRQAGARVAVAARRPEVVSMAGCTILPWQGRLDEPFDILVNATPLGADGQHNPFAGYTGPWRGKIILEGLIHPRRSPLMDEGARGGARVIAGVELWLHQGARQMSLMTGRRVDVGEMRLFLGGALD